MSGVGAIHVVQRFELAAALCDGMRVLDLSDVPQVVRRPLDASAREVVVAGDGDSPAGRFDAVIALDGLAERERRGRVLAEIERFAAAGTPVMAALDQGVGAAGPRAEPPVEALVRALAERLPGVVALPQFLLEGALIGPPRGEPALRVLDAEAHDDDATAVIVAHGFEREALSQATASLRLAIAPVLLSYVRQLEIAHAELLRANRGLMRERVGREGSAAASLVNVQQQIDDARELARRNEEHARRVEAWYDAPRYHLADRVRDVLIKVPGLPGLARFLWSLMSTRAETPRIDAAANPDRDNEADELAEVTREREALAKEEEAEEPAEIVSRLEE
jgi:hypothetical protein